MNFSSEIQNICTLINNAKINLYPYGDNINYTKIFEEGGIPLNVKYDEYQEIIEKLEKVYQFLDPKDTEKDSDEDFENKMLQEAYKISSMVENEIQTEFDNNPNINSPQATKEITETPTTKKGRGRPKKLISTTPKVKGRPKKNPSNTVPIEMRQDEDNHDISEKQSKSEKERENIKKMKEKQNKKSLKEHGDDPLILKPWLTELVVNHLEENNNYSKFYFKDEKDEDSFIYSYNLLVLWWSRYILTYSLRDPITKKFYPDKVLNTLVSNGSGEQQVSYLIIQQSIFSGVKKCTLEEIEKHSPSKSFTRSKQIIQSLFQKEKERIQKEYPISHEHSSTFS